MIYNARDKYYLGAEEIITSKCKYVNGSPGYGMLIDYYEFKYMYVM